MFSYLKSSKDKTTQISIAFNPSLYMVSTEITSHSAGGRPTIDAFIVYAGRGLRDMGRGLIAVILAIYLSQIGLSIPQIGLVLGASLVGGLHDGWDPPELRMVFCHLPHPP